MKEKCKKRRILTGRILLMALGMMLWGSLAMAERIFYVKTGGGGDGSSWTTALGDVQAAIDAAASGDSVWIATGTYYPSSVRELEGAELFGYSFELKDGVSLYGGFKGNETSLSERRKRKNGGDAWDFSYPTVLTQSEGNVGGVIRSGETPLTAPVILDGLVIQGGQAIGSGVDGMGGGVQAMGSIVIRNSLIGGNLARDGGGLALGGGATVESCGVFDNELIEEGWGGKGGGLYLYGDDNLVVGSVVAGNGVVEGGVQNGGGIYAVGSGGVMHCTIVGNCAMREGGGVWCEGDVEVTNSIIWGNAPSLVQANGAAENFICCAIEAGGPGVGIIPLMSDNCGSRGISSNENLVGSYYVCFVDPIGRNYRLGDGSYAINRALPGVNGVDATGTDLQSLGLPDIGAYATAAKGNLAADFSVAYPYIYGGWSEIETQFGIWTPEGCLNEYSGEEDCVRLNGDVTTSVWTGDWLQAGPVDITLAFWVTGDEAALWNAESITKRVVVRPRPLMIQADDAIHRFGEPMPELTWTLVGGRLIGDDEIVGELVCEEGDELGRTYPIRQGTLAVSDGNNGNNYTIIFREGVMTTMKGQAEITADDQSKEYDTEPFDLDFETDPGDVNVIVIYEGTDGTDYGPSTEPPTDAGTYIVTIIVDDPHYEGETTLTIEITPAALTIIADDKTRYYRQPNPELTMSFEGFKGGDGPSSITLPTIATEATVASPVRLGGYPITLTGGEARNYDLTLRNGTLTILKVRPVVGDATAGDIIYGDPLSDSELSGTVTNPYGDGDVPGTFVWDDGDDMPPAGREPHSWTFIPDDPENYEPVTGQSPVTVHPRTIVVSGGTYEKTYGDDDPEFTFEIIGDGLVGDDTFSGSVERVPGENAGTYPIRQGTLALNPNYDIDFREGTLTIKPAKLTVRLKDPVATREYGYPNPEFELEYEGFINGDTEDDLTLKPHASSTAELMSVPGDYPIVISGGVDDNYTFEYENGILHVGKAKLQPTGDVTASDITYGQYLEDSVLTGRFLHPALGLLIDGELEWVDDGDTALPAGVHEMDWVFMPYSEYYEIKTGTTDVTVHKAQLTVTVEDHERKVHNPIVEYELIYDGFVFGETEDTEGVFTEYPHVEGTDEFDSPRGTYELIVVGGECPNYELVRVNGTLTVIRIRPFIADNPVMYAVRGMRVGQLDGPFVTLVDPYTGEVVPGTINWQSTSLVLYSGERNISWYYRSGDIERYESFYGSTTVIVRSESATTTASMGMTPPAATIKTAPSASAIIYGNTLASSVIAGGVCVDPFTDETVEGVWQWSEPNTVPSAVGVKSFPCYFTPYDETLGNTETSVSVTVNPMPIAVKADSHHIQYGDAIPALTWQVTDGRIVEPSHLSGALELVKTSADGVWPEIYRVAIGTLALPEMYDMTFTEGTLMVSARKVVVAAQTVAKKAGEPDPMLQVTIVSGLGSGQLEGSLTRDEGEEPGEYTIRQGTLAIAGGEGGAQNLVFVEGKLVILENEAETKPMSSRVVVNAAWADAYEDGAATTFQGTGLTFGYDAFTTVEEAIANVASGGCVQIVAGNYEAPGGEWVVTKPMAILGWQAANEGDVALTGTIRAGGIAVGSLLVGNLVITSADDSKAALVVDDGVGSVVCLNSVLVGKPAAVQIGVYTGGVTLQNNDIVADGTSVRCVRSGGQAAPSGLLYMGGNAFEGSRLLEDNGFPYLLDKNLFNGEEAGN